MEERNELGTRIKQLRESRNETQADLAKALSVLRETVNHWENGTRDMKSQAIIAVAVHFGVTCDFLLRGIEAGNVPIHEKTGLSQDAIENLAMICGPGGRIGVWPKPEHVNKFLADPNILWMFNYISDCLEHAFHYDPLDWVPGAALEELNTAAKKIRSAVLHPNEYSLFLQFSATSMFTSILTSQTDELRAANIRKHNKKT